MAVRVTQVVQRVLVSNRQPNVLVTQVVQRVLVKDYVDTPPAKPRTQVVTAG